MPQVLRISLEATGPIPGDVARRLDDLRDFHVTAMTYMLQKGKERLLGSLKGEWHTNNLQRSLVIGDPDNTAIFGPHHGEAGSTLPYASKVNEGGMIYPSEGKALAIPLTDSLKRGGDNWPRDRDPGRERLKVIPLTGNRALLVDPDDPEAVWLLVPSVDWGPGYHFLEFRDEDIEVLSGIFFDFIGLPP